MCGKFVVIELGMDCEVKVWACCTPDTSDDELKEKAKDKLISKMVSNYGKELSGYF